MKLFTYYAVVEINTGKKIYSGISLYKTAKALVPGTCCATGTAQAGATLDAQARAKAFREGR